MSYLKNIVPVGAEDLLLYFDHTYVNGKFRPGRPCKNNIVVQYRRIPPLFPLTTWNVNLTTLSDGHRTNNVCESWNSRFSHMVGKNHPTIWKLISKIRYEIGSCRPRKISFK